MKRILTFLFFISLCVQNSLQAESGASVRADSHGPISVMGDHTHNEGEWMVSYRFMRMRMQDNRVGTTRISSAQVLGNYMMSPESMDMSMHMLGAMYAPSNKLTLTVMGQYISNSMTVRRRNGTVFNSESSGVGDTRVSGLYRLQNEGPHRLHANFGLSVPTGSISALGPDSLRLPYPMQLGSGTWDVLPGLTYWYEQPSWTLGSQILGTLRLGHNGRGYRLGNRFSWNTWAAYNLGSRVSSSLRVGYETWGNIDGADAEIETKRRMMPTADPNLRSGTQMDAGLGVNVLGPEASRWALEFSAPFYQFLRGPQLETDWRLMMGLQYSF